MKPKFSYDAEAAKLATAIDISIESFLRYVPEGLNADQLQIVINSCRRRRADVLNPSEASFRAARSLKEDERDAFTYFNEASGETVEYFWRRIEEEGLPYKRVNLLDKILKRGRISRRTEYDYVQDILVAAQQDGTITSEQAARLSDMIGDYEFPKRKKA